MMMFLPVNTTLHLQPTDRMTIANFKDITCVKPSPGY